MVYIHIIFYIATCNPTHTEIHTHKSKTGSSTLISDLPSQATFANFCQTVVIHWNASPSSVFWILTPGTWLCDLTWKQTACKYNLAKTRP